MIRVGLVGLGLIGRERLHALRALQSAGRPIEIVGVVDPYEPAAEKLAADAGTSRRKDLTDLLALQPDWVFIATPHAVAVESTIFLLNSGVRILVEKPLGRSASEAERIVDNCMDDDQLWVGLNYRFFDGIAALLRDVREGRFGQLVSMNVLMGHGGAPGMETSWKIDPVIAGGGCLIDPGIHLLDLCLLVAGDDVVPVGGQSWNGFWRTGVEEECHLLLRGRHVPLVTLQVSIVQWRSTFHLEVRGDAGYGLVEGRNKSYGPQTYRRGRRWGWTSGISQIESEERVVTSENSDVLEKEIEALWFSRNEVLGPCRAQEALKIMKLLDKCRDVLKLPV